MPKLNIGELAVLDRISKPFMSSFFCNEYIGSDSPSKSVYTKLQKQTTLV